MPTINQKKEIIKMINTGSLRKALFEKSLIRETNPALIQECKKAIAEADGALRALILTANILNIKYKSARMKTTDLPGLCREYGIDQGGTSGPVFYDGYELDGLQTDTVPAAELQEEIN